MRRIPSNLINLRISLSILLVSSLFCGCEDQLGSQIESIVINEFLSSNSNVNPDGEGDYDDWFELYNPNDEAVDLSGYYLTDDFDEPGKFIIADGTIIQPGRFLLFWADGEPEEGERHCNFKLSADGEEIGLFDPDGILINEISFGAQTTDISYGRSPDGSNNWELFGDCEECLDGSAPTPATNNE